VTDHQNSSADIWGALKAVQHWDEHESNPASYGGLPKRIRAVVDAALTGAPAQGSTSLIEACAKIAEPWAGFWLDKNSTEADRAVVAVRTEIAAKIRSLMPTDAQPARRGSMAAQFTYDPEGEAYYFAPLGAQPGPYYTQRHVDAILDIAFDGTLAGVELIDRVPPPPCLASQPSPAATVETSQFETTKAGVIDWKMEAERANRLLAQAERPKCRLCGLEDGACICAHLPPRLSAGNATDPDLVQRCRELLGWSKTGLLNGGKGGAVRAYADRLKEKIGEHYALNVAESNTKDEAMREIVRIAAQPQGARK
jgi:hypothetical protein